MPNLFKPEDAIFSVGNYLKAHGYQLHKKRKLKSYSLIIILTSTLTLSCLLLNEAHHYVMGFLLKSVNSL